MNTFVKTLRTLVVLGVTAFVAGCASGGPFAMVYPDGVTPNYARLYSQPPPVLDTNIVNASQITGYTDDKLARKPSEARRADLLTQAWHLRRNNSPCYAEETLLVTGYDGGPDWPHTYAMVCVTNETGFARMISGSDSGYTFNNWYGYDTLGGLPTHLVVDVNGVTRRVEIPRDYHAWAIRNRGQTGYQSRGCTAPAVIARATANNGQQYKICVWGSRI
ncbi:MAG TPA: hypothetical protein VHP58_07300 [Alphaproteobacteria bacterium]|nr:hypothetical protein [Alphaproteobacteria bacterium]